MSNHLLTLSAVTFSTDQSTVFYSTKSTKTFRPSLEHLFKPDDKHLFIEKQESILKHDYAHGIKNFHTIKSTEFSQPKVKDTCKLYQRVIANKTGKNQMFSQLQFGCSTHIKSYTIIG